MRGAMTALHAEILANETVAPEHFVIALAAPEIAAQARPGQFAMLRVPGAYDPLLPRAFSFYRITAAAGRVEFLYRTVGKGTRLLAAQRPGAKLHLWGPLGNGFELPEGPSLLIGGGVGVPPLVCLAEQRNVKCKVSNEKLKVRNAGLSSMPDGSMEACFGFATAAFIVGEQPLEAAGVPLRIATDDGTRGHRGFVTDLLREVLTENAAPEPVGTIRNPQSAIRNREDPQSAIRNPVTVYACGPHPMLAAVARLCEAFGAASQLALEAPMACGVGACIGCTVPRREGGYARVCSDGPVFRAEEIAWD